jgi:hypothetical protein
MAEQARYTILFDEKLQLIREHVEHQINEEEARAISSTCETLVKRFENPRKIKFLVVVLNFGRMSSKVRKVFISDVKREDVYKVALVGSSPYLSALLSFFFMVTGLHKMKLFAGEQEAIRWLNE